MSASRTWRFDSPRVEARVATETGPPATRRILSSCDDSRVIVGLSICLCSTFDPLNGDITEKRVLRRRRLAPANEFKHCHEVNDDVVPRRASEHSRERRPSLVCERSDEPAQGYLE